MRNEKPPSPLYKKYQQQRDETEYEKLTSPRSSSRFISFSAACSGSVENGFPSFIIPFPLSPSGIATLNRGLSDVLLPALYDEFWVEEREGGAGREFDLD